MADTVNGLADQKKRDELLTALRKDRLDAAQRLEAIDEKLKKVENDDFYARIGAIRLKELSLRERSEIVAKLGPDAFEKLLFSQRR